VHTAPHFRIEITVNHDDKIVKLNHKILSSQLRKNRKRTATQIVFIGLQHYT